MDGAPGREHFTKREWEIVRSHNTPTRVQRYLSALDYNREQEGETLRTFREVVRRGAAHCLEAALTAAVMLEQHGHPPLLLSLASQDLLDHVLFVFKRGGLWGAVARSRDLGLHGRRPVFRTLRQLVWSYFDPYVDGSGRIVGYGLADLRDLSPYDWRFSAKNVWKVERHLQELPHLSLRSSDRRYQKLLARYAEFRRLHPTEQAAYYDNRDTWML
ncbi:MAG: hypothetical protein WCD76_04405 [Pyrinomonadaceae bacterium]